jgi:hypothetical protein
VEPLDARGSFLHPAFERAGSTAGAESRRGPLGVAARAACAVRAAGETAVALACTPERTFRAFRFEGGLLAPAAFSLLLASPSLALWAAERAFLWEESGWLSPARLLLLALGAPILYVYLRAQALHLGLVLGGRARGSFAGTFRVVGYTTGAAAPFLAVPVAGEALFLLAGALLETLGLKECHGLTLPQAVLAEALPPAALVIGMTAAAVTGFSVSCPGGG